MSEAKRSPTDLEPGDHLLLIYDDDRERAESLCPFAREALGRGDRCLFFIPDDAFRAVTAVLQGAGVDVDDARAAGRIVHRGSREGLVQDGTFDAEAVADLLVEEAAAARSAGHGALWFMADMYWTVGREHVGAGRAVELWATSHLREHGIVAFCNYDRSSFDPDRLVDEMHRHSLVVVGDEIFPNPHHLPPDDELRERGVSRADWMIRRIEEAHRREGALRHREARLESLLENIPDVVARVDPDLRFLFVNRAVARAMERPRDEIVGRTFRELGLEPEKRRRWIAAVERAFATERPQEVEMAFDLPSGATRWFRSRVIPEPDAQGDVVSVLSIGQDVTEEHHALERLRDTSRLMERTLESLEEAVFVISVPGRIIVACNRAACEMFGYEREEMVGRSTERLHPEETSFERFDLESAPALLRDGVFRGRHRMRRRDGTTFPTEHTVTLLDPDAGLEAGVVSVVRDTSERERVEELLDTLGLGLIRIAPSGRMLRANRAAGTILRAAPDENLAGRDVRELLAPGQQWESIRRRIVAGRPGPRVVHARVLRRDGTVAWVRGLGRLVEQDDGEGPILEGVFQDVTEEVRLREEVVEISTQERRRIGQDLHDDLGQHLTGMAFVARDVGRRLREAGRPEAEDLRELETLANLAVMKTRHIARGVQPPLLRHRGLQGALEDLAGETEELFGLALRLDLDEDVRTRSEEEAAHLYRIAKEAVTNAARHGGAENVHLTWQRTDSGRRLTVRDDGAGFDPGVPGGEGVGLRIMDHRARLLGGSLEVESGSDDGGTVVRCDLPAEDEAHPNVHPYDEE